MSEKILPKISIVTPSFNQGEYLEAAIHSVLSQKYHNIEYIIIDGGSTDNSLEIIKKYANHLHFWCSEADDGHYPAVNKGFARASGDIFAWLNSDDMYCPGALTAVGEIFAQYPKVSWVTTLLQVVWDRRGARLRLKRVPGYSKEAFLDGRFFARNFSGLGYIQQESTFWRRRLWDQVGGIRREFNLAGDFDLWARFFLHEKLYGVDQALAGFRVHGANRSKQTNNYTFEAKKSLDDLRNQLRWTKQTRDPILMDICRKIPIIGEFSDLVRTKRYQGEKFSQNDSSTVKHWRVSPVFF